MSDRGVFYHRVSTDEQADKGYSLPSQRDACMKYALEHGFSIVGEFSDDYTGTVPLEQRPEGKKAFTMLKNGQAESVFEHELSSMPKPDAILVTSMMTYWYPGVFEVIKLAKARYPEVPVILGGVYATLCNDHARDFSKADMVISGPGECETLSIIQKLTGKDIQFTPDLSKPDKACPTLPMDCYLHENLCQSSAPEVARLNAHTALPHS